MRGVQIYIYGLFFFLSIVEGGLSERVVSGWGGEEGVDRMELTVGDY